MGYVQDYLAGVGERKCEANALVVAPTQGRLLCRQAIERYVGQDAPRRFKDRWLVISKEIGELRDRPYVTLDQTPMSMWDIRTGQHD